MDSWNRSWIRSWFVRAGSALTVVLAALAGLTCGKASEVFFDLPQQPDEPTPASASAAVPIDAYAPQETGPPPTLETLDDPDSVLALLPRDAAGYVDWMAAIREGLIRPRRDLPGEPAGPNLSGFEFDFRFQGMVEMFDAFFPHSAHVQWLDCKTCHPGIFPYRGIEITMAAINQGEYCGRCHAQVAFPASNCGRCHTQMQTGEGTGIASLGGDLRLNRAGAASDTTSVGVGGMARALFPHWVHRIRYRCSACHPRLFEARRGSSSVTMADLQSGKACGACHDGQSAFGVLQCNRCHVPVEADPEPGP